MKRIPLLIALLLSLAVGLFFALLYPYHLHHYEHLQIFQFSSTYFHETVGIPGGLADYGGRFLTQFFHITWAGSLIMALLFGGVYWATVCTVVPSSRPSTAWRLFWSLLSLLPIRFLWVNACDENAMPALYLAFLFSLVAAWGLRRCSHSLVRRIVSLLFFILLYYIVGPLSFLFAALMALHEVRQSDSMRWLWALALLFVALVTPRVAYLWANYPLSQLYLGIHYFRFPDIQLPYIWQAVVSIVVIDALSQSGWAYRLSSYLEGIHRWVLGLGILALMGQVIWLGVRRAYRPNDEVAMMYDDMVLNEQWDDILQQAAQRTPKHPACIQCINLAMAMKGQMGDLLFRVPQSDIEGLIPRNIMNFSRPMTAGAIYYNIGWTNTAQRFYYEAQEAIPDFEKSARCYQALAKTHIIRGDRALARKYLLKLTRTLFYADWAQEQLRLLANPDPKAITQHPEYGPMVRSAVRDDYFYTPDRLAMMGNYCTTTPHNNIATQYFYATALLERDLATFVGSFNLNQFLQSEERIPVFYQQALLLHWYQQHQSTEGIPYAIDSQLLESFRVFLADREAGLPEAQLQQRHFFTYWYYYYSKKTE